MGKLMHTSLELFYTDYLQNEVSHFQNYRDEVTRTRHSVASKKGETNIKKRDERGDNIEMHAPSNF